MSDSPSGEDDVLDQAQAGETSNENTDSSADSSQEQGQTDGNTESSTDKKSASMLDAVKAAVAPKAESPTAEQGTPKPEGASQDPKEQESENDEFSPEELKALSSKTQRRIKRLTSELAEKDKTITGLESKAAEYDKIETFVRNSGLTNEVVAGTLQVAALMRSNPAEAYRRLTPIMEQLRQVVGETIPADLAQRVQQGYMTEEDARREARTRAEAAQARRLADERSAAATAESTRQAQQQAVNTTVSSIEKWEAQKAATDPDWNQKSAEISELVELEVNRENARRQQANPNAALWFPNPDEAVKLSEKALETVNTRFKRFAPKPRSITPEVPGGASNRNTPAPKNMLEVIRQTVGAAA